MEEYYLLTFESTHAAISTEKLLKPAEVSIMPVPRFISASCGISVRIHPDRRARAEKIFREESRLAPDEYSYYHVVTDKASGSVRCDKTELRNRGMTDSMLIFDLDGTLWDSTHALAESWGIEIARQAGLDRVCTAEEILPVMGLTMTEIADRLLPEVEVPRRYEVFDCCEGTELEYLREHGGILFDGVRETLDTLLDMGVPMAVVSNCQEGYIQTFIDSMDMDKYFVDYEEWGRTGLLKADNIRLVMDRNGADKAVYVGDIQRDSDAAHEAGIPCIYATYGFGEIDDADGMIDSFDELPAVLSDMGYLDEK